jgi:hypothetical protein
MSATGTAQKTGSCVAGKRNDLRLCNKQALICDGIPLR